MKIKEILTFDVPNAPAIPGLSFRRYLGDQDIPAIVSIKNAANKADNVKEHETVAELTTYYNTLRNTDMEKDIYIIEVNGEMISFGRTSWGEVESENMLKYNAFLVVHPDWRGKGIGRAMQPVLEARMLELSQQHRDDAIKVMETWSSESEEAKNRLVQRFGYAPTRYFFEMKRDLNATLPEAKMPEGLEIRAVSSDQYKTIFLGLEEAFRDHWGYEEPKEGDFERWVKRIDTIPAYNTENWVVVWDGDEVAGLILTGVHKEANEALGLNEGWMHAICVRRPWRKRGLASAMIAESMRIYLAVGLDSATLGVDTDNPNGALGLYERNGFKQTDKWITWRKEIKKD